MLPCSDTELEKIQTWISQSPLRNHPLAKVERVVIDEFRGRPFDPINMDADPNRSCTDYPRGTMIMDAAPRPTKARCPCCNTTRSRYLEELYEKLKGTGLLPLPTLNHTAVFLACAEVVGQFNQTYHTMDVSDRDRMRCLCLVENLLAVADTYELASKKKRIKINDKFAAWKKKHGDGPVEKDNTKLKDSGHLSHEELRKAWKDAIEVLRSHRESDFLWKTW